MTSFAPDPEREERRSLLQAAASGDVSAQLKLDEEYHVRVYSAVEREQYISMMKAHHMPSAGRRKSGRTSSARVPSNGVSGACGPAVTCHGPTE